MHTYEFLEILNEKAEKFQDKIKKLPENWREDTQFIGELYRISREFWYWRNITYPIPSDGFPLLKVKSLDRMNPPQMQRNLDMIDSILSDSFALTKEQTKKDENFLYNTKVGTENILELSEIRQLWWDLLWTAENLIQLVVQNVVIENDELSFDTAPETADVEYRVRIVGEQELQQYIQIISSDGYVFRASDGLFFTNDAPYESVIDIDEFLSYTIVNGRVVVDLTHLNLTDNFTVEIQIISNSPQYITSEPYIRTNT